MVQVSTFVLMMICFIGTLYLTEKYLAKKGVNTPLYKILIFAILWIIILSFIVMMLPLLFPTLIYSSIIIATFICTYSRHYFEKRKEMN